MTDELARQLARKAGLTIAQAHRACREYPEVILSQVVKGRSVRLDGLGTLRQAVRKARRVQHPATGEALDVPARPQLRFRPAGRAKKALRS